MIAISIKRLRRHHYIKTLSIFQARRRTRFPNGRSQARQIGFRTTDIGRLTLAGKLQATVPGDDIVTKEIALAGIQRPLAITELGDGAIEMFRYGDFAGWIVPAG
ncbi:MAG: hypothetical protein LCH61_08145 [Proteobacteria bacterium]|nr:hypothetical protein [Pseudomonadota bacterium]